jgi:hypothetical protein
MSSTAVAAFENLHMHPGLLVDGAAEGDDAQIADPGAHLLGNGRSERLHHRIGERIAGAEAGDRRRRKDRVGERALRRHDRDRTGEPAVLRNVAVDRAIEQDRAQRQPDRTIDGTLEGHIDGPVGDLRRRPGQVDGEFVAADLDGDGDLQIAPRRIRIVEIAVNQALGGIDAVGNVADRAAHQPLGVVHQVFIGAVHRVAAVAAHEVEEALRADLRRSDLSIHVADN